MGRTAFGDNVRARRVLAGLSKRGLAARCGVARYTVQRWERGDLKRPPNAASLRRVAAALDCGVAELLR